MRKTKPIQKKSAKNSSNSPNRRAKQKSFQSAAPNNPQVDLDSVLQFIEDFRKLSQNLDEERILISLRVPTNVLCLFRSKAELEGKKYQSVIVQLMRRWAGERGSQ